MATVTFSIGTGVGSAGTGNVVTDGTTAVASGAVATAFTSELTRPGTIEIAGTLYDIASITDDDNLVTEQTVPTGTDQSYNIGSRNYSTITLWEADLDDTVPYDASDDAVGECYDDSAFDENVTLNGGTTIVLTSVTLTVASAERHDGTVGNGARMVQAAATNSLLISGTLTQTVKWLEVDGQGNNGNPIVTLGGSADVSTKAIQNMIVHDAERSGINSLITLTTDNNFIRRIENTIVYDSNCTGTNLSFGIRKGNSATARFQELRNCTVHNVTSTGSGTTQTGVGFDDSAGMTVINVLVTDADSKCFDASYTAGTANNNMASDDTDSGTGSIGADDGVLTSETYVSTTGGSEDLHLKAGSDAIDAGADLGTTPTGVNIDINGRDRDSEGDTWDIGAHELVAVATGGPKGPLGHPLHGPLAGPVGP